mgnify:CR=1 FL=1
MPPLKNFPQNATLSEKAALITRGLAEIARLTGWASMVTPLANCSSTSFCSEIDDRYSIIFAFRLAHRSCVMQRPASSPRQFSLPPQLVASIGSSTATMMSATVIVSDLRPSE